MSIARPKNRFLLLVSALALLTVLVISLTISGVFAHFGTALWYNIGHTLARGPEFMSHYP